MKNWAEYKEKAIECLSGWLSHENELGKKPHSIVVEDEFDYEENHYFIIKYKKGVFSKWWVGVCGLDEDGEECGHTFSEFEVYDKATAKEKCIEMIEYLKEYWRSRFLAELERVGVTEEEYNQMSQEEWQQKREEANQKENGGKCNGFVLLEKPEFDFNKLVADLKADWKFEVEDAEFENNNLVFEWDNNLMAVALVPVPVPNGEAEHFAAGNYTWKEAVETTKKHSAQLIIFAMNRDGDTLDASIHFSKVVDCCLNQKNALGVYSAGTVHQPEFYKAMANLMKNDELPVALWVYLGIGKSEGGNDGYTYGLNSFGKTEIEIIGSDKSLEEIREFLYFVCLHIIKADMNFYDGETLRFTSDEEYTITKSEAVYVDGETFKISY